ncbi:hypothetical protein QAD02_009855 [Eretmocerus hayati]|uniref:Uncharacterized protein n=1 Tax=Eretmocerus hayati TaxID=131215 RepID=A0ACC2NAJ6_9HYME|nr:hypothetical protein QAD02_009855 [Eretmocerus hayati]
MAGFIILLGLVAIASGISYALFVVLYQYTYWKRRKMLHVESTPIIGNNAPIVYQTESFATHSQNLYKNCPGARYYGMFDFTKPAIVVKDPELIREIGVKSFEDFTDHSVFVDEKMDPYVGRNLFSLKGDRWKEVRKTVSPSFTTAKLKSLFDLIAECSKDFVQYFVDHPEVARSFEAKDAFTRYATDVIGTSAFGVKVNSMKDRDNGLFVSGQLATKFTFQSLVKTELLRNFPHLMRHLGATFLPRTADAFFKKLISDTLRLRRETGLSRPDMVQLMMQAIENGEDVCEDDIVGQAFFFILAGFDTSASNMCFIVHELAANPDIQDKLRDEIDGWLHANNQNELTYEGLSELRYLDMVVSESLRKYPTAPFTNRVCVREHVLPPPAPGYPKCHVEKGTVIMIPIMGLHLDPQYFPDPQRFDPERFSEENKSNIKPYAYLPFGIGPRLCIGNRFALLETKIIMVDILRNFVIKFTNKSQHPLTFGKKGFSTTAEHGFWIAFERREDTSL